MLLNWQYFQQYCWKFYQQCYWIFSNIASNIKPGPTSFPYLQLPGVQLSTTSLVQPVFTVYSSQNLVLAKAAPATTVQTPQTLCTAVQLSSCMISPNLLMYSTVDNAENFTSCLTGAAPLNINALVGESSTWSLAWNGKQNVYRKEPYQICTLPKWYGGRQQNWLLLAHFCLVWNLHSTLFFLG